jgi:hypothetical protein
MTKRLRPEAKLLVAVLEHKPALIKREDPVRLLSGKIKESRTID